MKHMKIVKVPETTKKIVDLITCDLCGKKIEERNYDISEVEVRHKKGKLYQDSGSGTETCFDLCCASTRSWCRGCAPKGPSRE